MSSESTSGTAISPAPAETRCESHATIKLPVSVRKFLLIFSRHKLALPCSANDRNQQLRAALSQIFDLLDSCMTVTVDQVTDQYELFWVNIKASGQHESSEKIIRSSAEIPTLSRIKREIVERIGLNADCLQIFEVDTEHSTRVSLTIAQPAIPRLIDPEQRKLQLWSILMQPHMVAKVVTTDIQRLTLGDTAFMLTFSGSLSRDHAELVRKEIVTCTSLNDRLITAKILT